MEIKQPGRKKRISNDLKFKLVFENSIDAIVWADANTGIIINCNPAAVRLFGKSKKELIGIHQTELHPPAKKEKYAALFTHMANSKTPGIVEAEIIRADGTIITVEISTSIIDIDGSTIIQGIFRDITDRRNAESFQEQRIVYSRAAAFALRILVDNREFKSKIMDVFEILLEAVSASRVYLFKNEEVEGKGLCQTQLFEKVITGIEPHIDNPILQKLPYSVLPNYFYETLKSRRPLVYKFGENEIIDKLIIPQDIKTMLFLPIFCGSHFWGYIGFDDCVSLRKWREEVLNLLQIVADGIGLCIMRDESLRDKLSIQEELFQMQKMESLGRLAGGMAHDFNNMISVINGYAHLLLNRISPEDPSYKYVLEIKKAGFLSAKLTRQLLVFAKKVPCQVSILSVNESISSILKMLKRLVGENIQVIWQSPESQYFVMIDTTQFDQLIANLVINAKEAIKGNGTIKVELESAKKPQALNLTNYDAEKKFVAIKISDNGCGIPLELRDKIFEPFFTTKEERNGTGLGLSIVFGIVKNNGGYIQVHSEVGKGTCFEIYLPEYSLENPASPKEEKTPEMQKGSGTILVVDDSENILDLLKTELELLGYNVLTAKSPKEAITIAETSAVKIPLLIADFLLPEMNGVQLYNEIKKILPDIKCLLMSACFSDFPENIDENSILQKPFSIEELSERVKKSIEK